MRRLSLARAVGVAFVFLALSIPALAQPTNPRIKKLEKDLADLEKKIAKEEQYLEKKLDRIKTEYGLLLDKKVQKKLVQDIEDKAPDLRKGGPNGDDSQKSVRDHVQALLKKEIGDELFPLYEKDLSTLVWEVLEVAGDDKKPDVEGAVSGTIGDAFPTKEFEKDLRKVIKPTLRPRLRKLLPQHAKVEQTLKDARNALAARAAGIPAGMVRVEGGTFTQGIDSKSITKVVKKLGWREDQLILAWRSYPEMKVTLEPYYIDRHEVPCSWYAEWLKTREDIPAPSYSLDSGKKIVLWKDRKIPEGFEKRPVTGISLEEAKAFAFWMGRRLPTESEWELAARYTQKRKELRTWPWGDDWNSGRFCNAQGCDSMLRRVKSGLPPLMPVGSFPEGRSALGLDDLAGNAAEWTSSLMKPYPKFKDVSKDGRSVRLGDFDEGRYVVRGGHCSNRDAVVSTWWRNAAPASGRFPWVGFRTAASTTRGKDHLAMIQEVGEYIRFLVDFPKLPSDDWANRDYPNFAFDDPNCYSGQVAGGWDAARELPCAAKRLTIVNRACNDFRNVRLFRKFADNAGEKGLLLGFLHTDVALESPALEPGSYFVLWRNSHVPEEEDEVGKDGEAEKGKEKGKSKRKPKRKSRKSKGKSKRPPLPDAILFQKMGGRRGKPVRLEKFLPPALTDKQPSSILPRPEKNEAELVFSFPVKSNKRKSFVVSVPLKFKDEGTAADLH